VGEGLVRGWPAVVVHQSRIEAEETRGTQRQGSCALPSHVRARQSHPLFDPLGQSPQCQLPAIT
jgi:hypothetical protein